MSSDSDLPSPSPASTTTTSDEATSDEEPTRVAEAAAQAPRPSTTEALEALIGADALIWNDFRWPHPPLAWGDLLNVLDNEAFKIGVPKNDGQKDHLDGRDGMLEL